MYRNRLLFVTLICSMLSLIACSVDDNSHTPVIYFDKSAVDMNKGLWNETNFGKYSFEYSITGSGGIAIEAVTTVADGISETVVKTLYGTPVEEYSIQNRNEAVNSMIEQGYYLDSIEAIYACIDKIYKTNIDRINQYSDDINSMTLSVKYNEDGVPILIDTVWDTKQLLVGLVGPKVQIVGYTKSN